MNVNSILFVILRREIKLLSLDHLLMENIVINRYMRLLEPLSIELKLELLTRLTESVKRSYQPVQPVVDKQKLLYDLAGSWSDIDDSVIDEIMKTRTISDQEINLD